MIGTELLNALYGNPLDQMARVQPAPNPNPQAPPRPAAPMPALSPGGAPGLVGGSPAAVSPQGGGGAPSQPLPQSGPPSAAAQSPPDLAQLYLQLMQRERSANEIDRGLAMMAAANAAPGTSGAIMNSVAPRQDAGAEMGNLMQLMMLERMQQMPAPQGIDPNTWAALPPDMRAKVIGQQATSAITLQQQGLEEKQKDLIEAQTKLPDGSRIFNDIDTRVNSIKSAVDNDGNLVMQNILSNPSKQNAAKALMAAPDEGGMTGSWYEHWQQRGLSPQEIDVIANLKQLNNQAYGEAFQQTGSRRTQQEVSNLRSGLSQIANINQPYEVKDAKGNVIGGYMTKLNDFQNQLHVGAANAYGAAGQLDAIPDNLKFGADGKPLVSSEFLPGGPLYGGRGGEWASRPPPAQGGVSAPNDAVAYLKTHPDLAPQFDAKYGPGASKAVLGQ